MTARSRVLLVEDNPITQKLVHFALDRAGFEVRLAPDAATARGELTAGGVDLVLLDLVLPDGDGFSLAEWIRADPARADLSLLAFTGLVSAADEARISAVGFDDVVIKPIEPSRLIDTVRAHLPVHRGDVDAFGTGRRLLLADDDPGQRKLAAFRLRKLGFEVELASDGKAALSAARARRPDAIVSDVLMPEIDGFALCREVRRDPTLRSVPVLLVTNSYVAPADRELAHGVGAFDLVLRTPDLREALQRLRDCLDAAPAPLASGPDTPDATAGALDRAHLRRVLRQLERQVAINGRVGQRAALLSAELSVLTGIAQALTEHSDVQETLRHVLAACFDAAGISVGALYLCDQGVKRVLRVGMSPRWDEAELERFFGEPQLLEETVFQQRPLVIPSEQVSAERGRAILSRAGVNEVLLTPLGSSEKPMGALLTVSHGAQLTLHDRRQFAEAVAGQITQALAVAGAFAESVEARRQAQEQAAVLTSILANIADAVVVADSEGTITHSNHAAQAIFGDHSAGHLRHDRWSEAVGLFLEDAVTPFPSERLPLARAIRGESVEREQVHVRNPRTPPDGSWWSVSARPLELSDGARIGGVAVFRDVTAERRAQEQLMVADRMASLGLLAAGVAHEINNPLAAVMANLELIEDELVAAGTDGGEMAEMLADAQEGARRVQAIVRDLKTFSRPRQGSDATANLERVLASSARMAHNEIRHRATLDMQVSDLPHVHGSESRLGQVFLNLLVNAAQAIPDGAGREHAIRIRTRAPDPQRVEVEISDTGEGMDEETMRKLFSPFYTTKERGGGTGLGLAICHRIVTEVGGEIGVRSQIGMGTTFTVRLRAAAPAAPVERRPAPSPPTPSARSRILVVDDEPSVGIAVQRVLSRDHDVSVETDPVVALERVRGGELFDLVLCDLMMPRLGGPEFHAELARVAPSLASTMVILTGGAFTDAAREFLAERENPCIEKPFDVRGLRRTIDTQLRRS